MTILRNLKNGTSDEVNFKSVRAFKNSPKGKDKNLISAMIIDAVTKIVIAYINLKSKKV